jgi:mannose-6-phosphate isomerase-like protein (cupin superfamily)
MRMILPVLAIAALAVPALAQAPAPPPFAAAAPGTPPVTFTTAAQIQDMIAHSKATRKDEPQLNTPLLVLPPYKAQIEYRGSAGPPAVHETEAEIMYVVEGGATLVVGGKLVGEKRQNAANLTGTSIEGGVSRHFAKGDWAIVPQNTPHQIAAVDGSVTLATFHVPRTNP